MLNALFGIIREILSLFRIVRENKAREIDIKNQEDFKKREERQQDVSKKDEHEKLIGEVINAETEAERQRKLDEIRRVISR